MLFRELVAAKRKREDAIDARTVQAYQTAVLIRGAKGLPKLERLLVSKRRKQSPQEQAAMWQTIANRFGGSFKPLDRSVKVIRGR